MSENEWVCKNLKNQQFLNEDIKLKKRLNSKCLKHYHVSITCEISLEWIFGKKIKRRCMYMHICVQDVYLLVCLGLCAGCVFVCVLVSLCV